MTPPSATRAISRLPASLALLRAAINLTIPGPPCSNACRWRSTTVALVLFLAGGWLHAPGLCPAVAAAERAGRQNTHQEILILNSYHLGYAWSDEEQDGIIGALHEKDKNLHPVVEYLDCKRIADWKHLAELKNLFRRKYQDRKFSVVVAIDNPALEFAIDNQAGLFRNAPIVFCGINNYTPLMLTGHANVTGVVEALDQIGIIELMLRLHPKTREILVVHDYTDAGLEAREEIQVLAPRFAARVQFRFLDRLSMDEVLKKLEGLPKDSLVLLRAFTADKTGRTFGLVETTRLFTRHSPVPVYAAHEQRLGFGIVGGKLLSARAHGRNAGRVALRVAAGEAASGIPVVAESDAQYLFDYVVMKHFGIPLSELPEGSTVINRPVSFYDNHREVIQTSLGIIAFLTVIIILLMINIRQRRRSAMLLGASEAKYHDLYENAPDMYLTVDPKTAAIIECNSTLVRNIGYDKEELLGRSIFDIYVPDCHDEVRRTLQQFRETGEVRDVELKVTRKDGEVIDVSLNASAMKDKDGKITRTRSVWRDITDLKRAEAAIRESEALFKVVTSNSPDHLLVQDSELRYVFVMNPQLGLTQQDMIGKTDHDFLAKEDAENLTKIKRQVLETGSPVNLELPLFSVNGEQHFFDGSYVPKFDTQGRIDGLIGYFRNITEHKRVEEALQESEKMFRELVESINDIFYELDGQGIIQYVSPSVERTFGYNQAETIGRAITDFLDSRDTVLAVKNMRDVMVGHIAPREYRIRRKSGEIGWIRVSSSPVMKGDQVTGVRGVLSDITERKRLEEERVHLEERLHRSEKMEALGQLAGGVAHDLNNVLGVCSLYSELLQERIAEGDRLRTYADNILSSTQKAAAIIQDLLTLARRGVTVSDVMNLNGVIADFLKTPVFEKIQAFHPNVTFRLECDGELLNIKGSPVHMEKTVMNLMANAAEAIPDRGEVLIRTQNRYLDRPVRGYDEVKEGDYAVLTVSDTGTGIPAESMGKIFEPFYTKKTMGRSGTGLGLAIVWGTVRDHQGYIDVQTEVGSGTTFALYFPAAREDLKEERRKIAIEDYLGAGESILVVDDVAEQRDIAIRILTRLGYEAQAVSGGEEAVAYVKTHAIDLLVLDMIMEPGIDGLETYRRVLEVNPKQRAIIASGFSETERVKKAQELGAGPYVRKPYLMEKIGVAIRAELSRPDVSPIQSS